MYTAWFFPLICVCFQCSHSLDPGTRQSWLLFCLLAAAELHAEKLAGVAAAQLVPVIDWGVFALPCAIKTAVGKEE